MKTWPSFTRLVVLGIFASFTLISCGEDEGDKPKKFTDQKPSQQEVTPDHIRVLGPDNAPLVGAQYLIGTAQNVPFPDNFGVTNEKGEFPIPKAWVGLEVLTVDAPGFVRVSLFELNPIARDVRMVKKFSATSELRGKTTGHPIRNKDNIVDYSLVMSAMSRQDLLNFQIQKVMSPINDTIKVIGQEAQIPSNISLPRQTEKKLFFDITLDKPIYRLLISQTGAQRIFVARGRFPFSDVVDGILDKKSILDLINYFSITGGSIRDVNVIPGLNNLDVAATDLSFTEKKKYTAPKLASNQTLIALTASDVGGNLIPTDFKRVNSQQAVNLNVWSEHTPWLAQVLKNTNEFQMDGPGVDRLSARLSPFSDSPPTDYLPLIGFPKVLTKWKFQTPEVSGANVQALATYLVISDVTTERMNSIQRTLLHQAWEVYAPGWVRQVELPQWPWNKVSNKTRVEVSYIGLDRNEIIPIGHEMLQRATHVTRSSVDY